MEERHSEKSLRQREQEIIGILIDSDLYLGMELGERFRLFRFLQTVYDRSSAE